MNNQDHIDAINTEIELLKAKIASGRYRVEFSEDLGVRQTNIDTQGYAVHERTAETTYSFKLTEL